jgi:hypothetical protein
MSTQSLAVVPRDSPIGLHRSTEALQHQSKTNSYYEANHWPLIITDSAVRRKP